MIARASTSRSVLAVTTVPRAILPRTSVFPPAALSAAAAAAAAAAQQAGPSAAHTASIEQRRFASGGAQKYNDPTGYLFGEKPLKPGQKRRKQSWENIWYYGYFGTICVGVIGYWYKPDTSVERWALPLAKRNLDEAGRPWRYVPSEYSGMKPKESTGESA